ncbi:hypothetical protein ACWV26_13730 [Rummeliibacillus sp. JY-2-4R]
MKFKRKKHKHNEQTDFMLAAVIHGVLIGAAGILLFFFILQTVEKRAAQQSTHEPIPVSKSQEKVSESKSNAVKFYAVQYGVYSSSQAASDFLAGHPEYENAAIVQSGKQFYLWGGIGNDENKIKSIVTKDSFIKPFSLSGAACEEKGLKSIPQLLEASKVAELNIVNAKKGLTMPTDWKAQIAAMSKVSDDLEIVKLQLLAHYGSENDCLEIQF